jgi:nucleotide sugar dehydrogenase
LGYVGLPTAIGFHESGFNIWGVEISQRTVDIINRGENPTGDLDVDDIVPAPGSIRWNITTSTEDSVPHCDVILVTVPTPVTGDLKPDLSYVEQAGRQVFESITKGSNTVVVLESTVYPGVTNQIWLPIIADLGLEIGTDVSIAYCPERFNPGDSARGVRSVARVIGCDDIIIGESLVVLYSRLTKEDVRYVGNIEVAEAAKIIENVQRDINIALVNELARILPEMGVDVEDVLAAAATKWNFHRYTPGIGVGGHCIPVDPYYLIQRAKDVGIPAELITAGRAVNRSMPEHVANVLEKMLIGQGTSACDGKALLLGWTYKPGVADSRETPAEHLANSLQSKGMQVSVWDPHLREEDRPAGVEVIDGIEGAYGFDVVVLVTAHQAFLNIDWGTLKEKMRLPMVYDGRRVLNLEELEEMGWVTAAVGRPIIHG